MDSKSKKVSIPGIIGTVFFFVCYLPFCYLIYSAVEGQSGFFGGVHIEGFESVWSTFIWFSVIPVFPVCIIYQLIFGIVYIRKHKILKTVTIVLVSAIAAGILIPCLAYELKKHKMVIEAREGIESYLTDEYGEGIGSDLMIKVEDMEEGSYKVYGAGVLPETSGFEVYTGDGYGDNLLSTFNVVHPEYHEDFQAYVNGLYELPSNMELKVNCDSIFFDDYTDGDDISTLFERTDYKITGIVVNESSLDDERVVEIVNGIWEEQMPLIEENCNPDYLTVYIVENGKYSFNVNIFPNTSEASVGIYSDYDGKTSLNGETIELG